MAAIEGPLSKWTNVVKGWQYRWFVLDDNAGLLSYYTSKDKMKRGSRRGCVRLKGAIIGIDDEDDSTFTITVDHKTFHFQARDADERERWIETLENTIVRHSRAITKYQQSASVATAAEFDHKLAETDAYLQLLINQVKTLEGRIESCEDVASREKYNVIKVTANAMIEAIKHSIVMLQISKETLKAPLLNGSMHEPVLTQAADFDHYAPGHTQSDTIQATGRESPEPVVPVLAINGVDPPTAEHLDLSTPETFGATAAEPVPDDDVSLSMPTTSYSSSDDEDFFDAEEDQRSPRNSPTKPPPEPIQRIDNGVAESVSSVKQVSSVESAINKDRDESEQVPKSNSVDEVVEDYYDELYDEKDEEGLGSLEKHGSIITHLLSQVRIGMDLTKVVLPTFILERRSLLEMFADFFAHPDLFVKVPDIQNPRDRMVQVVRWYMSAFHAGRNSEVAKKPYNPILGETFACYWNVPGYPKSSERAEAGPLPNVSTNNLTFIAEQVSHHPPISAYYAEHHNQRITLDGYVWTKSKFLGLSIGVHMIGQAVLSLLDWDEEYIMTFPNGYGRSILTVPWVEMGGKTSITCAKTGYSASIDFLTKPFYGGKKHRIAGGIYAPNEKKPFCTLDGEWNGVVWAKHDTGMNESFVDTHKLPITKKQVFPRDTQSEFESRRLWQNVTVHLKKGNVEKATEYKQGLEQRQRDAAKERKEKRLNVETNHFHEVGEHWVYDRPLGKRLSKSPSTPLRPL